MRKRFLSKALFLWAMMVFSLAASAADWPATLYMAQTSFTSTGKVSASGTDGVYEFEVPYSSSTTNPRYYIFSSASTSTNAKKGTYKVYGAASIADGTNIQPVDGVEYPLVDLSSKEDATALVGNQICAFMPLYYNGLTVKATVDLNKGTVKFGRSPEEEATTSLSIFSYTTTKPLATAEADADGIARYSVKFANQVQVYFAANIDYRPDTQYHNIWGSNTQVNPENVTVAVGTTYPLQRTTYKQVYSDQTCSFVFPEGSYDIFADTKNGTIQIAEFSGNYLPKPATLYMRSHTFGTSYGSSPNTNGTYEFTFDKTTSYTSDPFRLIFSDVSSLSSAQNSLWILGSTTEATSVTPEFGKPYPLVHVNPNTVSTDPYNGTFMPLYPQAYTVLVDLNAMTVTFTPTVEVDALTKLNILNDAFKLVGTAAPAADGKFHYSYHGNAGAKIFFTTAEVRADMQSAGRQNFGAGGHASPADMTTEYGKSYQTAPISYRRLYTEKVGFFELPGKCDIVFDPATNSLSIENYTGQYETYPATLRIKSDALSNTTYAEAEGHDGVYRFEYTTQGATGSPRNIVFTDAATYSALSPASWLLGASEDGSTIDTYPGLVTPLYIVDPAAVRDEKQSLFIPFAPYTYNITVDLKNMTAKWGDPVPAPASLKLIDDGFTVYARSGETSDGIYRFQTKTYSSHPLFISEATSTSELKEALWTFTANRTGGENLDIAEGTSPAHRSTYYNYIYNLKGFWNTPEGCNTLTAVLDTKANTIDWTITPVTPRPIEVLYLLDSSLEAVSQCVSDDSGVFEYDVTLTRSATVGLCDSKDARNDHGRIFYGSCVPYGARRVSPESGQEYNVVMTSPEALSEGTAGFYLSAGRYRVKADMNTMKVTFTDISRGGVWNTPESLAVCDDDLKVISAATTPTEGVFTFKGVEVASARETAKVVFRDTAEGGSIFGSNATGSGCTQVESGMTYELYMPDELYVVTDGASCFEMAPSTYDITVDFIEKKVTFVDPSIPVYPAKMELRTAGDEPQTLLTANGNGKYLFTMRNDAPVAIVIADPQENTLYGLKEATTEITTDTVAAIEISETPTAVTVPEGVWNIELNLADMTLSFTQKILPRLVSTNMPEGSDFHDYFGAGTDPEVVFTFNNTLKSVTNVWIVLGNYEGGVPKEGEYTALGLRKATYQENRLTLDLTGQHYTIPAGAEQKVHIVISGVTDFQGETLVSESLPGLPAGSLVFEYPFKEFERIAIRSKFNPEPGSNIDETERIVMSVSRFDDITFDNVIFTAIPAPGAMVSPSITVPAEWKRGATDADGFTEITVEVPMSIRGKGNFKLYFENLDIDDNRHDHEGDVAASYNTYVDPTVAVESNPVCDENVARIDEITLTWTHPIIKSVGNLVSAATIVNKTTGESVAATYSYPADEKSITLIPESPLTASGSYELRIAKGDLVFNDNPDSSNNPLELSYSVDEALGITSILISETDEVTVVSTSGVIVRHGKGPHTLDGLRGIYIVNGVKCMLGAGNTSINK